MSVPLRMMTPGPSATFAVAGSEKDGPPTLGVLLSLSPGRARVVVCRPGGRVRDSSGAIVERADRFEHQDWSPNTRVRRVTKEKMMKIKKGEKPEEGGAIDTSSPAASGTKDRIAKLKAKAKAKKDGPKPKREKKEKVFSPCGCGCGERVPRRFRPGHDARFYSWLKKITKGNMKINELNKDVIDIHKIRTRADVEKLLSEHGAHGTTQARSD